MSLDFGKLNFSVSFNPTSAFPLDARSYFESYDAAVAAAATAEAAGSSTTTYYYGQTIAVVDTGVAKLYTIQPDKTLAEVGEKVTINENVFAHDKNGKLDLLGFADAVAGAQLVKSADGTVSWVKPDTTTVEGLQTAIAGMQKDVEGIRTDVDAVEGKVTTLVGDDANKSVRTIANEELVKQLIPENASESMDTLKEIADWIQKHPEDASAMNTKISGVQSQLEGIDAGAGTVKKYVDDTVTGLGLGDYAKKTELADGLSKKVDKAENERLMTTAEGEKLAAIAAGAQVNVIDAVSSEFTISEDGKVLNIASVDSSKVTGLSDALIKKVDKIDGSRLITDAEGTKLAGIADNAQVNVIDAVSNEFTISSDGKELSISAVAASKVTGLDTALSNKVDVVEGKGLSTNDLTDDLLSKLNASQANVIEAIKLNGSPVEVVDKAVDIVVPTASDTLLGLVKSSTAENKVSVAADGTMEVVNINVNKLVQTDGEFLILNGGSSK